MLESSLENRFLKPVSGNHILKLVLETFF